MDFSEYPKEKEMCMGSGACSWEDTCLNPWVVSAQNFQEWNARKLSVWCSLYYSKKRKRKKKVIDLVPGTTRTVFQISPGNPPLPALNRKEAMMPRTGIP